MEEYSNEIRLQSALNPEGVNPMTRATLKKGNIRIERQRRGNQTATFKNTKKLQALTQFRTPGLTRKQKKKQIVLKQTLKNLFSSGNTKLNYPKLEIQDAKTSFDTILLKVKAKTIGNTNEAKAFAELYAKLFVYMYLIYQFQQTDTTSLGDFLTLFQLSEEEIDFKTIFTDQTISNLETVLQQMEDLNPMIEEAYFRIKPKNSDNPIYTEQLVSSKEFLEKLHHLRELL